MTARVVDYQGRLAVRMGEWLTRQDEPVQDRLFYVSDARAEDYQYLIDANVEFAGDLGKAWPLGAARPTWLATNTWERVLETRPVKKPRRGRDYDWEWRWGRWRKVY